MPLLRSIFVVLICASYLEPVLGYPPRAFLSSSNRNKYINFNNFGNIIRLQRQSPGFDWDTGNAFSVPGLQASSADRLVFDNSFTNNNNNRNGFRQGTTTSKPQISTLAVPGMGTTQSPCEDRCLTTPEYNPVCGNNNMTYFSHQRLLCAKHCGIKVALKHFGKCSIIPPRG